MDWNQSPYESPHHKYSIYLNDSNQTRHQIPPSPASLPAFPNPIPNFTPSTKSPSHNQIPSNSSPVSRPQHLQQIPHLQPSQSQSLSNKPLQYRHPPTNHLIPGNPNVQFSSPLSLPNSPNSNHPISTNNTFHQTQHPHSHSPLSPYSASNVPPIGFTSPHPYQQQFNQHFANQNYNLVSPSTPLPPGSHRYSHSSLPQSTHYSTQSLTPVHSFPQPSHAHPQAHSSPQSLYSNFPQSQTHQPTLPHIHPHTNAPNPTPQPSHQLPHLLSHSQSAHHLRTTPHPTSLSHPSLQAQIPSQLTPQISLPPHNLDVSTGVSSYSQILNHAQNNDLHIQPPLTKSSSPAFPTPTPIIPQTSKPSSINNTNSSLYPPLHPYDISSGYPVLQTPSTTSITPSACTTSPAKSSPLSNSPSQLHCHAPYQAQRQPSHSGPLSAQHPSSAHVNRIEKYPAHVKQEDDRTPHPSLNHKSVRDDSVKFKDKLVSKSITLPNFHSTTATVVGVSHSVQSPTLTSKKSGKMATLGSSGKTSGALSRNHSTTTLSDPPTDNSVTPSTIVKPYLAEYHNMLICLAEEYVSAAHKMVPLLSSSPSLAQLEAYYRLISAAFTCYDCALKKFQLNPRVEGQVRLRYASLLLCEVDSSVEVEATLTKGITLCERYKLLDIKYSMQHVLVRAIFKGKPRAALKLLDMYIQEVETYQNIVWVYSFRFMRFSLSLQSSPPNVAACVQNMRAVQDLSRKIGDDAIYMTAAAFEALSHLRSSSHESIQNTQQAIALARSRQLSPHAKDLMQIISLLDFIDLAAALQLARRDLAKQKLAALQHGLDSTEVRIINIWKYSGLIHVPINSCPVGNLVSESGGIFSSTPEGNPALVLSWLQHHELYTLGYYFSGLTMDMHNMNDLRAQSYLNQGLSLLKQESRGKMLRGKYSFQRSLERMQWHELLEWHITLHQGFTACTHEDWQTAGNILRDLELRIEKKLVTEDNSMKGWMTYLRAIIQQGKGNLDVALSLYGSDILALPADLNDRDVQCNAQTDLQLLAALHKVIILRGKAEASNEEETSRESEGGSKEINKEKARAVELLNAIEPMCLQHPNRSIVSVVYLLRSASSGVGVLRLKQWLQTALHWTKDVANNQLLRVCLALLCSRFFVGMVGGQAEKSARTTRQVSQGSRVWLAVADGLLANTLEVNSKAVEAQAVQEDAQRVIKELPEGLRKRLEV